MKHISVAIDGPSGAGKSTLARRAAKALGFRYLDTGAIYRTVGLAARDAGADPDDPAAVTALLPGLDLAIAFDGDDVQHMYLGGRDVSGTIRENDISRWASRVSAIQGVRDFLLETQRRFARENDVVMDGRDIGTVVLPGADVKGFLTADPEDRAMRRYRELRELGQSVDYDSVLAQVLERDRTDTTRAAAPLRQAEDAVLLDTTGLAPEESLSRLLHIIRERLGML